MRVLLATKSCAALSVGLWLGLCLVCLVSASFVSTAQAFTEPRTYYESAANGGGGGRFFTGSPAEGYGCTVCHTGPAKVWPLEVIGLPENGYVPGASYDLRLRFREFASHAAALRERERDDDERRGPPSMGLVAELVSESGEGAGTLELSRAADAREGELCIVPEGQLASQLYAVRPGEAVREQALSCEAKTLGQRCIIAARSCGASEVRLTWTAPERWQGPIWFSAGFVTTEAVSGDPKEDAVTEIKQVLLPASTMERFAKSKLASGCSVLRVNGDAQPSSSAPNSSGSSALGWALLLACVWAGRRTSARARLRARRAIATSLLACGVLSACDTSSEARFADGDQSAYPKAGLFTPGSELGALPPPVIVLSDGGEAGVDNSEFEDAINEASGQDRCVDLEGAPGVPGTLMINFGTASYHGFYDPENCGAVWIEDPEGNYVATPAVWAALRTRNIFVWRARRCASDQPDVVSSATLPDHREPHEVTWDGKDRNGHVVPNGSYVLNIEVTEDEFDYGRRTEVPFEWGTEAFVLQPGPDVLGESVHDLTMTFTPAVTTTAAE